MITKYCCKLNKSIETGNTKINEGVDDVKLGVKANNDILVQVRDVLIPKIASAGKNAEISLAPHNNGTRPNEILRIEDDHSVVAELGEIKREDFGAFISFVSDLLSAALDNPEIRDEVKKSVDSVVKKYWKDVI